MEGIFFGEVFYKKIDMSFNKFSFYKIFLLCGATFLMVATSCVQVKKATLYDGVEVIAPAPKPTDILSVVESDIYSDDATDVWGLEKDVCQDASITNTVVHSGSEALKVTWNRNAEGCKFAGIGIGWDSYAGKDLSEIMDYAAIQMYVRSQEGKSFGLAIVLTLIDYSGGMGFAYTSNKYFERTTIDEEWQKVLVPLSSFDIEIENLDPTNIKQLQLELQQSGSIYLDDISLVFYEPEPQKPWMVEEVLPNPTAMPIQILADAFINNNAWGLISDPCQTIELSDKEHSEGQKSLHLKWDNSAGDCKLTAFGASWNKWRPVDVTAIRATAAFQFDIKSTSESTDQIALKIGFEDYDRAKVFVSLDSKYVAGGKYSTDWKKVTVPLSAIPDGVDFTRIKQLYVELEKSGEVYIDNLRLVKLP
ncbi:MAG: hypothetical protein ACI8P3_001471 [Saprospiraceae bacterium]